MTAGLIGDMGAVDATELAEWVAHKEVSPTELLDAALAAVTAHNPKLNAVVMVKMRRVGRLHRACRKARSGACPSC